MKTIKLLYKVQHIGALCMIYYVPMASTIYTKLQLNPYSKPNSIFLSRRKDSVKK